MVLTEAKIHLSQLGYKNYKKSTTKTEAASEMVLSPVKSPVAFGCANKATQSNGISVVERLKTLISGGKIFKDRRP